MRHILKTDRDPFEAVLNGMKRHEIRDNTDRNFQVGDILELRETVWTGAEMRRGSPLEYTGRITVKRVTHIQSGYGLQPGWIIMSIADTERPTALLQVLNLVDELVLCRLHSREEHPVPANALDSHALCQSKQDQVIAAIREVVDLNAKLTREIEKGHPLGAEADCDVFAIIKDYREAYQREMFRQPESPITFHESDGTQRRIIYEGGEPDISLGGYTADDNAYDELLARKESLEALINTPELKDFREAVVLEAAHQRERWGSEHDAGKTPFDWVFLIGHLATRAATNLMAGNKEKALHHAVTTAAACANWHASMSGASTNMRPGTAGTQGCEACETLGCTGACGAEGKQC